MDLWGERVYSVFVENRREREHWGDLGVDGRIIFGWIFGEIWVYRDLVGKPEGKSPLGRPRLRCVNNIRMYLWVRGSIGSCWENGVKETIRDT
jgi:hypothetical protein